MDYEEQRESAIDRIKAKREFWTHFATYVIVNLVLVGIWALSGGGYFWPIWSIFGWGIGLVFHAWSTFYEKPITEDAIQKEIDKSGG